MGLLKWLFGDRRVAESDNLVYIGKYTVYDYGHKYETHRVIKSLDAFWETVLDDQSTRLTISCTLNGRTIPMIDADSEANLEKVNDKLYGLGLRNAVFESSPGRFWVFPDMSFKSFTAAWKAMLNVPGNDLQYLKFTERQRLFQVRGEPKKPDDPKPRLIHCDLREKHAGRFVSKLTDHFSHGIINAVIALRKPKKQLPVIQPWIY